MIKLQLKWIFYQILVNLRSMSFIMMVLLMGMVLILTDSVIGEYNQDTEVALIYSESDVDKEIGQVLCTDTPDGFVFRLCADEEELKELVTTGKVSCGIVLSDASAVIYQTAGSADGYIAEEIVYAAINRVTAGDRLSEYLDEMTWEEDKNRAVQFINARYETYLKEMNVKLFNLDNRAGDAVPAERDRTKWIIIFVMSAFMFIICLYDTAHSYSGFWGSLKRGTRVLLYVEKVVITVVMVSIGAYLLWIGHTLL